MAEYIELKSTLYALDDRRFLCSECLSQYAGRADYESMNMRLRESKACTEIRKQALHSLDDEILYRTCVGNFFKSECVSYLEMFQAYERGVLPFEGVLLDQPNKIMEIFRVIENYKHDKIAKEQKAFERDRKRQMISKGPGRR